MNKKLIILTATLLTLTPALFAANVNNLQPIDSSNQNAQNTQSSILDKETVFYPNANINSAIAKYKKGNYTGCLQELFSLTKKDPSNALAYYYMGMAFTHVNMQSQAVEAYEKAISLNPNSYIADYATKGRDCLTDGPACKSEEQKKSAEPMDELDKFINAPYGNGLSPEVNAKFKEKQLKDIQETINKKDDLGGQQMQKIKNFDEKNKSSIEDNIKIAQVSDEEILQAVKTLQNAGLNLTVQQENPYAMYQDPKMMEMSMLLGNNNNNNNNMMYMMPMLMSQAQKGENIDPRIMQTMLMNSMMSDFGYSNNNNNRY